VARTDRMRMGTRFEKVQGTLDSYVDYGGRVATQLYMRAYDNNGNLLPGSVRLDQVGLRANGTYDFMTTSCPERSPLTDNQEVHYAAFARNGGVIYRPARR
jgi:hypothetical protein